MQTRKSLRERCNGLVVSVSNSRFKYACRPVLQSLVGGGHSPEHGLVICLGREQNLPYFKPGGRGLHP